VVQLRSESHAGSMTRGSPTAVVRLAMLGALLCRYVVECACGIDGETKVAPLAHLVIERRDFMEVLSRNFKRRSLAPHTST
jgi:hypothetical protein